MKWPAGLAKGRRIQQVCRIQRIRLCGADAAGSCRIEANVRVSLGFSDKGRGKISIGERCTLAHGVVIAAWGGSVKIADDVFLGPYAVIYGHGDVEIGESSLIAMHCRIVSSDHSVPPPGVLIRSQPNQVAKTVIGTDVWFGAGVSVLKGVHVGNGCVVGAGAVVTRSLPDYSIATGVPARVVGTR